MNTVNYFDAHTHHNKTNYEYFVYTCPKDMDPFKLNPKIKFIYGLHPWNQDKVSLQTIMDNLEKISTLKNLVGIGEVGIDYHRNAPHKSHWEILSFFLNYSYTLKKPAILHLVRCETMFLNFIHEQKNLPPIMIHAYSFFDQNILKELKKYDLYYSLGVRELNKIQKIPHTKRNELIPLIIDRILLETDDNKFTIEECYLKACEVFSISLNDLSKIVEKNFKILFV